MSLNPNAILDALELNGQNLIKRGERDYTINCPFCPEEDPDTKGKCYLTLEHEYGPIFHCFRCNSAGSIHRILKKLNIKLGTTETSLSERKERLARLRTKRAFHRESLMTDLRPVALPEGYVRLEPDNETILTKRAYKWLRRRGLDWTHIVDWKIGYCTSGPFGQHLIIPVQNREGNIISFQARRFIGTVNPKSKNPYTERGAINHSDVLFGVQKVRTGDVIFLVEGPFDVFHLNKLFAKLGFYRAKAVALLGHEIGSIQISQLRSLDPQRVYVMMDSDVPKENRKIGRLLARWLDCPVYITELKYGDPDDLSRMSLLEKIEKSYLATPKIITSENPPRGALKTTSRDGSSEGDSPTLYKAPRI